MAQALWFRAPAPTVWPRELPAAPQPQCWDRAALQSLWHQQQQPTPSFASSQPWSQASSRSASPPQLYPAPHGFQPIAMQNGSRRRLPKERKTTLIARQSSLRPDAPEFVPSAAPAPIPIPTAAASAMPRGGLSAPTHILGAQGFGALSPTPQSSSFWAAAGTSPSAGSLSSAYCSDSDPAEALDAADEDDVEDGMALSQKYLYHRYVGVLDKALAERASVGPGNSPLVHSLYTFWIGRLTHKFNRNMYRMFVRLALEDHTAGDRTGLDALYRFYCSSLRSLYRERLFRDFVHFVSSDLADNNSAVEMLWLLLKDFPRAHQDGVLRCYPDLCAALETLDALGRFSLE